MKSVLVTGGCGFIGANWSGSLAFVLMVESSNAVRSIFFLGIYQPSCVASISLPLYTLAAYWKNCPVNNNSVLEANVNLYPNPSNGLVNIIATLPNVQNLDITISNTLGQLISVTKHIGVTNNVFTLDLNSYGNGVYFVTINNGQEKIVKRVILNK